MLSWLYGKITNLRNAFYERGVFASHSLGAPTVSVGNITVGGTGKTPMVAFVAGILAERGAKVCILTRGYGRENPKQRVLVSDGEKILADARTAGDEPFELAVKLRGQALVIADADRTAAAKWAREKFGVTAFVLDDAFQHRRARRDLDIVLLDATNPFGNSKTLPFGILREPLENIRRADLIILTRADQAAGNRITDFKLQITNFNPDCPVFTAKNQIASVVELKEFHAGAQRRQNGISENQELAARNAEFENNKAAVFCALGNPDSFFEQLRREGFHLTTTLKFPDHHAYAPTDVSKIETEARRTGAEILLTTAKDAVKLADLKFALPCFVVESRLIFDDKRSLSEIIRKTFIWVEGESVHE